MINKKSLKHVLGDMPLTAELYWLLRQPGKPLSKSFSLRRVEKWMPQWREEVKAALEASGKKVSSRSKTKNKKKVLIFSTLRYWIEHTSLIGMALAGMGYDVSLAYLPYANWRRPMNRFDLRRQNVYARRVLGKASPYMKTVSLLDVPPAGKALPPLLDEMVREICLRDAQYTLQVEDIDPDDPLYQLRLERNIYAARAGLSWLQSEKPYDQPTVLLTPNGSILEMGVLYQAARHLNIPVVTYEFGEQTGRIWFARDAEVMRQETDDLWSIRQNTPLTEDQLEQVRSLYASRLNGDLWENFTRRWQGVPSQGGTQVRQALALDERPIALLAANVIGDSLTLGRQVFTQSMTEWLERTIRYFAQRPDIQFIVRIHPGERYTQGPSVADIVRRVLQTLPASFTGANIHLVAALDTINTYDIVQIADLGLAYTTTVGMEMAMMGVPVIVAGHTHYRGKGFTMDPTSWESYFNILDRSLASLTQIRPTREQVERAWNYAYRFFFEYPRPFPWHLLHFGDELIEWPIARLLSPEGQAEYGQTLRYLAGEPREW